MSLSDPSFVSIEDGSGLLTQEDNFLLVIDEPSEKQCDPKFDKFATETECGEVRFRRLRLLGYV